ncbi:ABC transporter permease [Chelativorans composti]|uniref:ABC transporter permease n=1 Tax=Chelativorans composti TaxID=768533 RepID=A0ABW5DL24_9HYPH
MIIRRFPAGAWIAALVCAVFVFVGVFGSWLAPKDPNFQNLLTRLLPPFSPGHPLGTDALGRDVLSRLIAGAQVPLIVSMTAVPLSILIGVAVGLISGYVGGAVDAILMRLTDAWLAFPFILLAIAFVAVLGPGIENLIIALVASHWAIYVRLVRGQVLSLREREFVTSARMLGVSDVRIAVQHILPAVWPSVIIVATLEVGVVIVTEASLSFLGLGVSAAQPTWGAMLSEGRAYISSAWWLATLPGIVISIVVLAINYLGNILRDLLDPRSSVAMVA